MSFDANMKKLNDVVEKLEDKNTTLEDGIGLYEQGIALSKDCLKELEGSKGKIALLQKELNKLVETDFDAENM